MRKGFRLIKGLIIGAAALLASVAGASAITINIDGSYTITQTPGVGNEPSITDNFGSYNFSTHSRTFVENNLLETGPATTPTTFFTISPSSSCGRCGRADTAMDTINVTFTFTSPSAAIGTVSDSAVYTADYKNDTDSLQWSKQVLTVAFTDGNSAEVFLPDQFDWDIKPTISFEALDPPTPSPEPITFSLFAAGLAGAAAFRRRRKGG